MTANARYRTTTLDKAAPESRAAFHLGWIDAQNGRAFRPEYAAMPRSCQAAYEQGRLSMVAVIAAGWPVPRWDGSTTRSQIVAVSTAINAAVRRCGAFLPVSSRA